MSDEMQRAANAFQRGLNSSPADDSPLQRPSSAGEPTPIDELASPAIAALARSLAAALAQTIAAYLPVETRSVEARLDALDLEIGELKRRLALLGESVSMHREMSS